MKKIFQKAIEAIIYCIIMNVLISMMIPVQYRAPLQAMSVWVVFAALLIAVLQLILGGEEGLFSNTLNKVRIFIFGIYIICFAGVMALDSFGELLNRLFAR